MERGVQRPRGAAALVLAAVAVGVPATIAGDPVDPSVVTPTVLGEAASLALTVETDAAPLRVSAPTVDVAAFRRAQDGGRFFSAHLLPRFERQFADATALEPAPLAGHDLGDHALYDWMTDDASARAERATRKALRDSLLETATLSRIVGWAESRDAGLGGGERSRRARAAEFDLGISHGLPRITVTRGLGPAEFRAGVSARGTADVSFAHPRLRGLLLSAGWNPGDDRVDLGCRIGF